MPTSKTTDTNPIYRPPVKDRDFLLKRIKYVSEMLQTARDKRARELNEANLIIGVLEEEWNALQAHLQGDDEL